MQELLEKRIGQARKGREYWIAQFGSNFEIESDQYILLLTEEGRINEHLLQYLPKFLKNKKSRNAIIVYQYDIEQERIQSYEQYFEKHNLMIQIQHISKEDMDNLLAFYCMYQFTGRLVIGSIDKPEGRTGSRFIEEKRLTLEEMVVHVIYDIRED
jgi:hypothetical protein